MHKQLLNAFTLDLTLEAAEPLLVRSGAAVVRGPDMAFVRTRRGDRTEPYLPGTGLKGALRSHAERIARALRPRSVCGVFNKLPGLPDGCSTRLAPPDGPDAYAQVCPACRLFGSLHWKGRFEVADAYLTEEHREIEPELRDGIGIDRVSGGVAGGAKFDFEAVPAGVRFQTRLRVTNFEAWMLGWMAYVARDLADGYVNVGGGSSRGFGRVTGHLDRLELTYTGEPDALTDHVPGIGALVTADERALYGLQDDDIAERPSALSFARPRGSFRSHAEVEGHAAVLDTLAVLAPAWDRYIPSAAQI